MFEKNLTISYLLDFYGDVLPDRKKDLLTLYYNDDYSLAEIADEVGISRQGVRDALKKAEESLLFYEEKLGLWRRFRETEQCVNRLLEDAAALDLPDRIRDDLAALSETLR